MKAEQLYDFVKNLPLDENEEVTVQVPHKNNTGEVLIVTFKRIKLGDSSD